MTEDHSFTCKFGPSGAYSGSTDRVTRIFVPWELKHVSSISETITGTSSTIGIPNKPAYDAKTYDVTGAYRQITVTGMRLDSEEYISNVDFIYNELNDVSSQNGGTDTLKFYSVGILWLPSNLQVTKYGYTLSVSQASCDNTFLSGTPGASVTDTILVASGPIQYKFSDTIPGGLEYTLKLTESRPVGTTVYTPTNEFPSGE